MVKKNWTKHRKTTTPVFEKAGDISGQWSGLLLPLMSLLVPYKRIRISKSGKFCLWSQKSGMLGFELQNTAQGTRNSSSPDKEPGSTTWNLESTTSASKTVLVSFNGGVTSRMTNIPGVYSTRMDQRPLQCWRPSLLKWTMKRKTYLCLFSLKNTNGNKKHLFLSHFSLSVK